MVVPQAHAVIDPLAVVVEPGHALVADVAVAGIGGAQDLAGRAQGVRVKLLNEAEERYLCRSFEKAGVCSNCKRKEEIRHEKENG